MSYRSLMIQRCDLIQRNVVIGQDDYGRDIYGEAVVPGVPCRLDQIRVSASRDAYGTDFITQNIVFLPPDYQIAEDMTVNNIVDRLDNPVLTGSFGIEDISPVYGRMYLHHYEVSLQKEGA